jgi:hypothetical protein
VTILDKPKRRCPKIIVNGRILLPVSLLYTFDRVVMGGGT